MGDFSTSQGAVLRSYSIAPSCASPKPSDKFLEYTMPSMQMTSQSEPASAIWAKSSKPYNGPPLSLNISGARVVWMCSAMKCEHLLSRNKASGNAPLDVRLNRTPIQQAETIRILGAHFNHRVH
ncbi:hypothetical protein HPB50_012312 [Hyalomma asiaticum]|uniref:Uncharacterized protein n=1 Tax=Hyalomma asiaticum TaxID=266040 RepID=A0ACB7TN08_HYAAI|nr:hypothetical protein HPB50_012312 [Hyalomma asiaticum]